MRFSLSTGKRVGIVLLVSLATVAFHYGWIVKPSPGMGGFFHAIHGRLCYIPIILGAVWFGVRGGLITAFLIILLTLPYGAVLHAGETALLFDEYTEMFFYVAIGLVAGVLIELQRRERERSEALSRTVARQEHLSSLGQMAAGLAHEIKNPLGSIRGAAEVLADDFPEGSEKHEIFEVLSKESTRLDRVVEEFLAFARPRPLDPAPVDINEIVSRAAAQMRIQGGKSGIEVTEQLDGSIGPVSADSERIHQVFLNIGLNGLAAMSEGGTMSISTRAAVIDGEPWVEVSFKDSGRGIEKENLEKIFDPFYTTKKRGTGLGLSISHMIVERHGGRIEVDSIPGEGSEFKVLLPAKGGAYGA